jgi:hypothetical protein
MRDVPKCDLFYRLKAFHTAQLYASKMIKRIMPTIPDAQTKDTLKQAQGSAYSDALDYLATIVDYSSSTTVDDYIITLAAEESEGMYYKSENSDEISWHPPAKDKNQHLEIVVQDKDDKRFIPELDITAELFDDQQNSLGVKSCPFLWHPYIFHYGSMWHLADEGTYSVKVLIKRPEFGRHDEVLGKRYLHDVAVTFDNIQLSPSREAHGPE